MYRGAVEGNAVAEALLADRGEGVKESTSPHPNINLSAEGLGNPQTNGSSLKNTRTALTVGRWPMAAFSNMKHQKKAICPFNDLVGSRHIESSTVGGSRHVVIVFHHLHSDVLGLQVVDEVGNIRVCLQKKKEKENTS